MASAKRKHVADSSEPSGHAKSKKSKVSGAKSNSSKREKAFVKDEKIKKKSASKGPAMPNDLDESDTTESENGYYGFSAKENSNNQLSEESIDGDESGDGGEVDGFVANGAAASPLPKKKKVTGKKQDSNEVASNGMGDGSRKLYSCLFIVTFAF